VGTHHITPDKISGTLRPTLVEDTTSLRKDKQKRDIVLVIDQSGSMDGDALDYAIVAAVKFCKDTLDRTEETRIAVVAYDSYAHEVIEFTRDFNDLKTQIEDIQSGGSTNMRGALDLADEMTAQDGRSDAKKVIVLLSDGLPNTGETYEEEDAQYTEDDYYSYEYASAVYNKAAEMKSGYDIYTLGFFHEMWDDGEMDFAERFLRDIQNKGYYKVEDPNDLEFVFGEIMEEVISGFANRIVIRIACPVDGTISWGGETLSSDAAQLNQSTQFGSLSFEGENNEIKVFTLDPSSDYNVSMKGTGDGSMAYTIEFYENDEVADSRKFENVGITASTSIASGTNSNEDTELAIDRNNDGVIDELWRAGKNATRSQPTSLYSLNVENGVILAEGSTKAIGNGYEEGAKIHLLANSAPDDMLFDGWVSSAGGAFSNAASANTMFTMPASNVTVTAKYKDTRDRTPAVTAFGVEGGVSLFKYRADGVGNILQLYPQVSVVNGASTAVSWSAQGPATVSADGLVTFTGDEGAVTVVATSAFDASKQATLAIKVVKNVTAIRTPLKAYYVQRGKSVTLPIALDDETNGNLTTPLVSTLQFTPSNAKALTVDEKGKIKANSKLKKKTKVIVTVTAGSGVSRRIPVYVTPKATKAKKLKVLDYKRKMKVGEVSKIKVEASPANATGLAVTFKSSAPSGLYVDKAGKIIAIKKGKYAVTVKAAGKKAKTKTITVSK
jgi:uncharacterized protein YegL